MIDQYDLDWHAQKDAQRNGGNIVKQDLNNEESWQNSVTFQFDI